VRSVLVVSAAGTAVIVTAGATTKPRRKATSLSQMGGANHLAQLISGYAVIRE